MAEGSGLIEVKVTPHARRSNVRIDGDLLRVAVVVAAENGKANRAVEMAVAKALGLRRREVRIVTGLKSRRKLMEVGGLDLGQIRDLLAE